jgi:putative hemolysin
VSRARERDARSAGDRAAVTQEPSLLYDFLIVLALTIANGIFAGAEIAVVTIRPSRVRELAESGSHVGRALQRLRAQPERFLSTVQIVITVLGATAAAFSGTAFAEKLRPALAAVPALEPHAHEMAIAIAVVGVSFLSIVLGELVPKSLALRAAEGYARVTARPLLGLSRLVRPAVWVLTQTSNAVLRVFGDHTSFTESKLSLQELRGLVDEARQGGALPHEAGRIASRVLEFAGLQAIEVMVHRRFVVALPIDASPELVRQAMLESGHRRTPVYRDSVDNVIGYVSWRDVLREVWEGRDPELAEMIRPCRFFPSTVAASDLLRVMRAERLPIAVIVDEHGGMEGIVTLEDLVEELVGEIVSEHDTEPTHVVEMEPDGSARVPGTAQIRDVNRELDLALEGEDWSTMNGLCIALAGGRIPHAGEVFTTSDGVQIQIADATVRRVRVAKIWRPVKQPTE